MQNLKEHLPEEIYNDLESYAYKQSTPFCYSCYEEAPTGRCNKCHSDDLMRLLPGNGVEYGIDWVMKSLIEASCRHITKDEKESLLDGIYPETTQIGWIEFDTMLAIKNLDPISFDMAVSENLDSLKEDQQVIEIGDYYWVSDIENMLAGIPKPQEKSA